MAALSYHFLVIFYLTKKMVYIYASAAVRYYLTLIVNIIQSQDGQASGLPQIMRIFKKKWTMTTAWLERKWSVRSVDVIWVI